MTSPYRRTQDVKDAQPSNDDGMLDALFKPNTIAVIGASRTPGKLGHELVANLVQGQFQGDIVPINPLADEILGLRCYPTVKAAGRDIDLVLICVPRTAVQGSLSAALAAGAKAVVVITAGYKESGVEGAELQDVLVKTCRQRRVRMLGPNCLGLINTHHCMNAAFGKRLPKQGTISIMSQSGALVAGILDWADARGIGLSKLVSMGNKADLCETDLLRAFAEDSQTKVIVGYLESITSGSDFIRAAEWAANRKPVVILKVGTTQAGQKASASHTGSLGGADIAYGAAFKRSGVVRADTFESLFDSAIAFDMQPLPAGGRVAMVTNAGGPGIMAADAAERLGLVVAHLSDETEHLLKPKLPPAASVGNPIDVLGDADPERYGLAVGAAQRDANVDAVIVILTPQAMTDSPGIARAIKQASCELGKPILATFMGGTDVAPGRDVLREEGIPDYPSPERAVAALHAMHEYATWRRRPPREVTRFPVNRRRAERVIARRIRSGRLQLSEVKAKEILAAYGFRIPGGRLSTTADGAVETAEMIGFPVAMKIVSPDIVHKSDIGGVKLNLTNSDHVRDAYDLMLLQIERKAPGADIEGVYVERMCAPGREVIIGMTRDPQFGPMLMFGLGGIFVEVLKDVAFHLAPITAEEARQMLEQTKSYSLLSGVRGQSGVDLDSVASGLQRISQLTTDFPRIVELDINPFIVGPAGTEPVAADARMTLGNAGV